jgi:DNA-binding Xre family transcriptional regulator
MKRNAKWKFDPTPIARMRSERGLSRFGLGRLVVPALSNVQIENIERFEERHGSGITVRTLLRVCNQLRISPAELFKRAA